MCHFRCPWNGMFDCHQVEITVMQFTGHPLPVHQFVPWDFNPVPYCQPNSPMPMEYALPPSLEWHVWPGRRSIYNTISRRHTIYIYIYIYIRHVQHEACSFYCQCYDLSLTSHSSFLLKYDDQKRNDPWNFMLINSQKGFVSLYICSLAGFHRKKSFEEKPH